MGKGRGWWISPSKAGVLPFLSCPPGFPPSNYRQGGWGGWEGPPVFQPLPLTSTCPLCSQPGFRASHLQESDLAEWAPGDLPRALLEFLFCWMTLLPEPWPQLSQSPERAVTWSRSPSISTGTTSVCVGPPPMSTRDLASWSTWIRGAELGLTPVGIWPGLSVPASKGSPLVQGVISIPWDHMLCRNGIYPSKFLVWARGFSIPQLPACPGQSLESSPRS